MRSTPRREQERPPAKVPPPATSGFSVERLHELFVPGPELAHYVSIPPNGPVPGTYTVMALSEQLLAFVEQDLNFSEFSGASFEGEALTELTALVEQAGWDPWSVEQEALYQLIRRHAAPYFDPSLAPQELRRRYAQIVRAVEERQASRAETLATLLRTGRPEEDIESSRVDSDLDAFTLRVTKLSYLKAAFKKKKPESAPQNDGSKEPRQASRKARGGHKKKVKSSSNPVNRKRR